jgi:hypothetical protein
VTGRPDPIEAWRDVSASAARATGFRHGRTTGRRSGLASIGAMTAALAIVVVALALRPTTPGIGTTGPVTATAEDGMFRLDLTTPRDTYQPGYAIAPVARVTYLGPDAAIAVNHSHSQLGFQIEEVGGTRRMEGGSRLSCETTNLVKGQPLDVPFGKSGSPTNDPGSGFDQAWYEDPTLTLPIGTWRITVNMDFAVGECGIGHVLQVSNNIEVVAATSVGPVVDVAQDSAFRLELTTPRRTYRSTEAIEPVATVTFLGPVAETSIHHGGSIVGFDIEEVDGPRTLYGGMTAVCATSTIRADAPLTFRYSKSGSIGGVFDQAWFDDPVLHLPVGTWRIHVYTTIATDDGPAPSDGSFSCGTRGHSLEVENVITVIGDAAPSVEPSPIPSVGPTPATTPSTVPFSNEPVSGSVHDGVFRLDLTTPHGIYGPDDVIQPVSTLFYVGPESDVTFGHGAPTISFRIEEVGGNRVMGGGVDDVCLSTTVDRGKPAAYDFVKGGTVGADFDRAWFDDPKLRLPVGTWRIVADLNAYVDQCGLDADIHQLTVDNVISVVDPPIATPLPSPSADASTALATVQAFESAVESNDIAANADLSRAFLMSVRDPSTDGAAAASTNLVAAPLRADGTWRIWLDVSSG